MSIAIKSPYTTYY